jgi:nucleoside-diphosphate-sugar epimerase
MARVLIVGCGCRGQSLARALADDGHLARGTTRDPARVPAIEAAGVEAVVADPLRLATITPLLANVSVVVWPLASATGTPGEVEAVHTTRLQTLLTKLIDSGVRGLVYEGAGSVDAELLQGGAERVRQAGAFFRMPTEVVEHDPADHDGWVAAMRAAVDRVLTA